MSPTATIRAFKHDMSLVIALIGKCDYHQSFNTKQTQRQDTRQIK